MSNTETASPVSLDVDTIIVDSGIDLAHSVSSATSISSENFTFERQNASSPIALVTNKSYQRDISDEGLQNPRTTTRDISPTGDLEKAISSKNVGRQIPPHSICRLLAGEQYEEADLQDGDSVGKETTSSEESSAEQDSDEKGSDETYFQGLIPWQALSSRTTGKKARVLSAIAPRRDKDSCHHDPQKIDCVSIPPPLLPKSLYSGWKHSLPISDERSALSRIFQSKTEGDDRSLLFHDIFLEDFVIYRSESKTYYPGQVVTLDNIVSNREGCKYLLNGVLKSGEVAEYVEAMQVDIDTISIDGFEDTNIHSVRNMVYLQTVVCGRRRQQALRCWYRLGEPSDEYRDIHKKFLWVADLAKHIVDYINWRYSSDGDSSPIHLRDFQYDFIEKLKEWHDKDVHFQNWLKWYGKSDFRVPINRHREFIFGRAYNLGGHYLKHDLWSELMVRPVRSIADKNRPPENTTVTRYVEHCCKSMPWSYALQSEKMSDPVQQAQKSRGTAMGFPISTTSHSLSGMAGKIPKTAAVLESAAGSGKYVNIKPEEALGRFAVVRMISAGRKNDREFSYVYIQGIVKRHGKNELKVIFVYLPSETICLDGYYPHGDELFLSDCCNCSTTGVPILLTDIVQLVGVTLGGQLDRSQDFFIMQKYVHDEDTIDRMQESDLQCPCRRLSYPVKADEDLGRMKKETLRGLSLFAGCGNFDMGLEAFGAIGFVAAIEIDEAALKTYAANRAQGLDGLVLDSVNPCLSQILRGSSYLPSIGSIELISAGSPCKGFSRANPRRGDDKGLRNCSLLVSTLSYIETYLPTYAVLENVGAMGSGLGNSCNQVIACLVGLGYQVRKMKLSSREYGSAQDRERLFVVAAAPNVMLPQKPKPPHTRATGFTKASAVSEGLPYMDNDDLICIPQPDHIAGARQTPMSRELIRRVPRFPKSMNFIKSIAEQCQGEAQLEWFRGRPSLHNVENHMAFTRLDSDGVIPTITTRAQPTCCFGGGRIIHWDEHRTLTLLEARRAQGFPDKDVIIGNLSQQWAQVGNAVNRNVAMALGKAIADSWFSEQAAPKPQIIVAVPARTNGGQRIEARQKTLSPSVLQNYLAADDAPRVPSRTRMLADQIHKEVEALVEEDEDAATEDSDTIEVDYETDAVPIDIDQTAGEQSKGAGLRTGDSDHDHAEKATDTNLTELRLQSPDEDAAGWCNLNKMRRDELGLVKEIIRPKSSSHHNECFLQTTR